MHLLLTGSPQETNCSQPAEGSGAQLGKGGRSSTLDSTPPRPSISCLSRNESSVPLTIRGPKCACVPLSLACLGCFIAIWVLKCTQRGWGFVASAVAPVSFLNQEEQEEVAGEKEGRMRGPDGGRREERRREAQLNPPGRFGAVSRPDRILRGVWPLWVRSRR
ncbi:Hypothetical predicted protein [Podarcis lilfordi]|uniref:Uncharacterized protein n=1 Tax=Podarcis lilfordi TaxID=74358 RepID=A0AA35NYJ3_9SAUR|nr:Hypothetical predicted protein [Podarcis lilfordi]